MDQFKIIVQAVLDELQSKKNIKQSVDDIVKEVKPKVAIEIDKVKLEKESKSIVNSLTKNISELDRVKLSNRMLTWLDKNSKAAKLCGKDVERLINECKECDGIRLQSIKTEFDQLTMSARQAGKLGKSFTESFKEQAGVFTQWLSVTSIVMSAINSLNKMKDAVISLDDAQIELLKVSDLTATGLSKVTKEAYKLGDAVAKTGTQTLAAATSFKRAGYDIADSMEYAEEALKTTNISENLKDAGIAAENLVHIMKGFRNETPEFVRHINDAINEVSNTQAVDFDNLVDGSERLSAVAKQAGMSFEQMLGTLTGGYEILGNMEKVASGQITIFSRLQAIQLEGEEEVSTAAKLQEKFANATKGAVNIIDQQTGELRSVYDILSDLDNVWDGLDKNIQEALAFEAAGIRQKSVFLAMMSNWGNVEKAVDSATNSLGSADKENEKYLNSISGKLEKFQSRFEQLSQTVISSDFLKVLIESGTGLISVLDTIIDKTGVLTPLVGALVTGLTFKNAGREKCYPSLIEYACGSIVSYTKYKFLNITLCEIHN